MTQPIDYDAILATLEAANARRRERRIDFFKPYPKQQQFLDLGATKRERLLLAGNQNGKTETGAYETALHLTGQYPKGWKGRRFKKPVRAWAAGESSLLVRDVQQKKLCGPPGVPAEQGTGMIPSACLMDTSLARGVTDAYDTIHVQWHNAAGKPDGMSSLTFKSYEQGRTKFQGEPVDWIWCDEEPPEDVYSECLTRTTATGGIIIITFTPLKGLTPICMRFLNEKLPTREVVKMTIHDAQHISKEDRDAMIASWPKHERESRANGEPMQGSGRIFTHAEDSIGEPRIEHLPAYWALMWAIDFGIGHPFAAVLGAWDRDNDVIHILHAIRVADQLPIQHAAAIKAVGADVPVAWPHDGAAREAGSGQSLASLYKAQDLRMLPGHATWPDGGMSTEAGILEMDQRFGSGRLKIANHLSEWFEEYRGYHRDKGQIVKVRDDLMSATRIFVMAKRNAKGGLTLGRHRTRPRRDAVAEGVDFDLS